MWCVVKKFGKHCIRKPAFSFIQKGASQKEQASMCPRGTSCAQQQKVSCFASYMLGCGVLQSPGKSWKRRSRSRAPATISGCNSVSRGRVMPTSLDDNFIAWSPGRFALLYDGFPHLCMRRKCENTLKLKDTAGEFQSHEVPGELSKWHKGCLRSPSCWGNIGYQDLFLYWVLCSGGLQPPIWEPLGTI
jgi:hypothetical protein